MRSPTTNRHPTRFPVKKTLPTALAAALLLLAGCSKGAPPSRTRPPPAVTTAPVKIRDVPVEVRAPVDLRPLVQADVGSKTLGYLDAVLVDRRSEEHTSELQSRPHLVCRLLLEKKKTKPSVSYHEISKRTPSTEHT